MTRPSNNINLVPPADSTININVGAPGPVQVQRQPGCLIQLLFFVFIGWWLGSFAVSLAYILFVLVVTIPLGVKIVNRIPYLMALRQPAVNLTPWGAVPTQQRSLLVRSVWFLLLGWWLAALWMGLAYLLCLTIIGMPAGFWMFDRAPAVLSLRRA